MRSGISCLGLVLILLSLFIGTAIGRDKRRRIRHTTRWCGQIFRPAEQTAEPKPTSGDPKEEKSRRVFTIQRSTNRYIHPKERTEEEFLG